MKKSSFILFFITSLLVAQEELKVFSLYYANDQFELTQVHYKTIDSIKVMFLKDSIKLTLKGYTNDVGNLDYNLTLSNKRVDRVAREFEDYLILTAKGYGEIANKSNEHRRVDIFVSVKEEQSLEAIPINDFSTSQVGVKFVIEGLYFEPGTDRILETSNDALQELFTYLKKNASIKIKLLGHICCSMYKNPAIDGYNKRTRKSDLSQARAKAIYDHLIHKGIQQDRVAYIGMAYKFPTGKEDQFDRRVEIEIISLK